MSRAASPQLAAVVEALRAHGCNPHRDGNGWRSTCPAHGGDNPDALSLKDGREGVVITCFTHGCTGPEVARALGLEPRALFYGETAAPSAPAHRHERSSRSQAAIPPPYVLPAALTERPGDVPSTSKVGGALAHFGGAWVYEDETGSPLFRAIRWHGAHLPKGKTFRQGAHDPERGRYLPTMTLPGGDECRRVFYRLPDVLRCARAGGVVIVVEGEKCADRLRGLLSHRSDVAVTTSPGGAKRWRDLYADALRGARRVVVLPDDDAPGQGYAEAVAASVIARGIPCRIVPLPGLDGGDVYDWIERGGTADELFRLVAATPDRALQAPRGEDAGAAVAGRGRSDLSEWGFVELDGVQAEPVSWLWPGWIPTGMLTIVDGRPDAGKTTMLCDIAARVTQVWAMPSETVPPPEREPGGVIFVTSENAFAQVLRPRLEAAGADLSRCVGWAVTPVSSGRGADREDVPDCPRLPRDAARLEAAVRHYGAALVIVDPLFSHMDGELNPNRETDVRRALVPLARIAETTGAAVVAVRHFNKAANGDAINAGGGSIGIIGTARVQLIVGRAPDVPETDPVRVVAVGKMNIAEKPPARSFTVVGADVGGVPTSRAEWGGIVATTAGDLTRAMTPGATPSTARDEVADWLREVLEGGPRLAREVWAEAEGLGFAERTVNRAKKACGVNVYRDGFGAEGGWWWAIPGAGPKAATDEAAKAAMPSHTNSVAAFGERGSLWQNSPENGGSMGSPEAFPPQAATARDMGNVASFGDGATGGTPTLGGLSVGTRVRCNGRAGSVTSAAPKRLSVVLDGDPQGRTVTILPGSLGDLQVVPPQDT